MAYPYTTHETLDKLLIQMSHAPAPHFVTRLTWWGGLRSDVHTAGIELLHSFVEDF